MFFGVFFILTLFQNIQLYYKIWCEIETFKNHHYLSITKFREHRNAHTPKEIRAITLITASINEHLVLW